MFKCKICYSLCMKNRFIVIDIYPRGFCKGVYNAIELAKKTRLEHPDEKISILGELVHNKEVSSVLTSLGINTVETKGRTRFDVLDDIQQGLVIFSAHGISDKVIEKARAKGLTPINASCEDVVVTQDQIKAYLEQDYEILYVGQKGHPEAEAVLDIDPEHIQLLEVGKPVPEIRSLKLFVTNQTTMSILDIKETLAQVKAIYPSAIISDEICSATRLRQEAILKLPQSIDGIIVIGDKNSNNTRMLVKIAENKKIRVIIAIQNLRELNPDWLETCHEVAITAGASTPKFIIDEIVNFTKAYALDITAKKENYLINPFI